MRPFIFFDVGGTLLHFAPSYAAVLAGAVEPFGVSVPAARREALVASARFGAGAGPDHVSIERNRLWWMTFFTAYAREAGAPDERTVAAALWDQHRAGDWLSPAADTVETLASLRRDGYRLGVISNWDDTLESILRRNELWEMFEVVVGSSAAGSAKPDKAVFRAALAAARVAPDQALHIGDDIACDVVGARSAGLRPVLIGPNETSDASVERIATLAELFDVLERFEGRS